MAVYTQLSKADIEGFLAGYDIGTLDSFDPIAEGVTNTNYLIHTTQNQYILTLFEKHFELSDLPYFTALMHWWSERGISCPQPIAMKGGRVLSALKERPALLVSFLQGSGVKAIMPEHLLQLGEVTARMHVAGMDFPHERENPLSLEGWEALVDKVVERADEIEVGLSTLISEEYNYLSEHWPQTLPRGAIHADLFPDNVFFEKPFGGKLKLSGIIDFYFACNDYWAYDLAIIVNAWCFDERQRLVKERVQALMAGYNQVRDISDEEEAAFSILLRGSALRFLLTRTYDWLNRDAGALVQVKDPLEYARKLGYWREGGKMMTR
jgi:homoserine kinase type II